MEDFTLPDFPGMPLGRGPGAPGLRQDHGGPSTPMPQRSPPKFVTDVGPRHAPPPPVEQHHDHCQERVIGELRDRIIYKKVVFEEFHKKWTIETGIQISMPQIQELSQYMALHGHWIDTGRLDEDDVHEMWNLLETVYRPSPTMKEAIIICRQGQVTVQAATRSKAPPSTWTRME